MAEGALRPGATALVTGASSGIGEAAVAALAARGARVVAAARRRDRLEALAARLGPAVLPLQLDVTQAAAVAALPGCLPADWREIDIAICNAGHDLGGRRRFDRHDPAEATAIVAANLLGSMAVAQALLPGMIARGRGHVVLLGSQSGVISYAGGAAYIASKWGVHGLAKALKADLQGTGVRVTEVLPGVVKSEFAAARVHGDAEKARQFYEGFKEVLLPEDVVRCILFALEQPPHVNLSEMLIQPSA